MVTVGQKLWYVSGVHKRTHEVVVKKVGRKWFELEGGHFPRISIETFQADGGIYMSPGRCYLSEQVYREEQELAKAWTEFQRKVSVMYYVPAGMTVEKIKKLVELLEV